MLLFWCATWARISWGFWCQIDFLILYSSHWLFSISGSGTFFKNMESIRIHHSLKNVDLKRLRDLIGRCVVLVFVPSPFFTCLMNTSVERGSSAVECQTRNRESPGSNPPLLQFRISGIFVVSMTLQFTQLYRWVPGCRQWWKCEWMVFARNCCVVRILPREVELVP